MAGCGTGLSEDESVSGLHRGTEHLVHVPLCPPGRGAEDRPFPHLQESHDEVKRIRGQGAAPVSDTLAAGQSPSVPGHVTEEGGWMTMVPWRSQGHTWTWNPASQNAAIGLHGVRSAEDATVL